MENPRTNDSEDSSSSGNEVSPYFQRPQSAIPTVKGKGRPEEIDEIQQTQQRDPIKKKCYNCAKRRLKCSGIYPFTERCRHCKRYSRRCYSEDEGKRKPQPVEEKCYQCRLVGRRCDGKHPFTQACSSCQARRRTCGAEKPERGLPKDQKCQRCAKKRTKCYGEPPFKNKCGRCSENEYECYTQRDPEKGLPKAKKCYPCAKDQKKCIGVPPFKNPCGCCRYRRLECYTKITDEDLEKGLPKDKKCHRCAKDERKCIGEPPFKNKCGYCKNRQFKCYAQAKAKPFPGCVGCGVRRSCDGKKPCTQCVSRNHVCTYKDGDVKWTHQPDPEKWKEPTFPTCNECVQWNQSHVGKTLPCDGKSPCNCCLQGLSKANPTKSPNCSYRYENGVSKFIKVHAEWVQILRRKVQSQRDRNRDKRQERSRQEIEARAPQSDTTAEDEDALDEDLLPNNTGDKDDKQSDKGSDSSQEESGSISDPGNSSDHDGDDSDAGGESHKDHPNQNHGHDHDHDHPSGFPDHENPKSNNNPNQKRAIGRDPSPPNDQNNWGGFESSVLEEDPPNESQLQDPQGYGDEMGHKLGNGRGSSKLKISRIRSKGGSRESVGRRRL